MRTVAWTRFTWRAGADRVAHAVCLDAHLTRTACGSVSTDERLAWPERSRCTDCQYALGFLPIAEQMASEVEARTIGLRFPFIAATAGLRSTESRDQGD